MTLRLLSFVTVLYFTVWPWAFAADVYVDTSTRYQTILGWGATASDVTCTDALRKEILDEAVSDLGLTRLRVEIPRREWEHPWNDNADPFTADSAAYRKASTDTKFSNWVVPFKQRVIAGGSPFNIYISPSFFDGGSTGSVPGWMLNNPGEYVEWAVEYLRYIKETYGVTADYYCICNEAGNGNAFSSTVVAKIIKTLGPRLQELGYPTKIEFPECKSADDSWSYINAFRNDTELWKYVGLVSYHLYGGNGNRYKIRDFAWGKGLPTAQTEYMGTTIDHLYDDLTQGGVSFWEHYVLAHYGNASVSGTYISVNFNLTSFSRYNKYWDFRQVMHYVRPGAVRIDAASTDSSLRVLAFDREGRITVVLINKTDAVDRTANLSGLPPGSYGTCLSTAGAAYTETGIRSIGLGDVLTVSIPANTVMTVYPYEGANQPPTVTDWKASPSYLTAPSSSATLSAGATDPELDSISYQWSVAQQPSGADATIADPNSAGTSVAGLTAAGDYVFNLAVSDPAHTVTKTVRLTVFPDNQPPVVVDLHNRNPVTVTLPTTSTTLRGGGRDLEGDVLTYQWTVLSQPSGASAVLGAPTAQSCAASNMTVPGDYVFRFEVRDPTHVVSDNLTVTVYPADTAPVISSVHATPSTVAPPASTTLLSAMTSDPDGDLLSHWWSLKSGPVGAKVVLANQGAAESSAGSLVVPGYYTFTLAAVARTAYATKDVSLWVSSLPIDAGSAAALADGSAVQIENKPVSALFGNCLYLEEPNRTAGIRVEGDTTGFAIGNPAKVYGIVVTNPNGERCVKAVYIKNVGGQALLRPLALSNACLGGGARGEQDPTFRWQWIVSPDHGRELAWLPTGGPNNIGLLVRTWGTVTAMEPSQPCFYIDDGTGWTDYSKTLNGVRVLADGSGLSSGDLVVVTGVSTCHRDASTGHLLPAILPRNGTDVTKIMP